MTRTILNHSYRIVRRAVNQAKRPSTRHGVAVDKTITSAKPNLLKSKKPFSITTLNTRTMNGPSKLGELIHVSRKYDIDITCLQEHRISHPNDILK